MERAPQTTTQAEEEALIVEEPLIVLTGPSSSKWTGYP
ncbi:hypothetical protein ACPOL_2553 [Acidisarcina polymorpha]|uniref:Uncharacterized protein n=1 Tax=Acidisarcina polymorpha TaxID=2211140 RepID=A0A2Z5FY93_9BACT|nr:hypothetical protein ACPOL_2553 [Acidisarcina polymorpha]